MTGTAGLVGSSLRDRAAAATRNERLRVSLARAVVHFAGGRTAALATLGAAVGAWGLIAQFGLKVRDETSLVIAVPAALATLSASALLGSLIGGGPGVRYLMLVAPLLLIGESMARGRGMLRGCGWAFAVLALVVSAFLLFANDDMRAIALASFEHSRSPEFLEGMRASMPP